MISKLSVSYKDAGFSFLLLPRMKVLWSKVIQTDFVIIILLQESKTKQQEGENRTNISELGSLIID